MRLRNLAVTVVSALALTGFAASSAMAARNPEGTGQPGAPNGVSCPSTITTPKGFNTAGFAHAGTVYANPGTTSGSVHAVSQYDIACYQTSQPH